MSRVTFDVTFSAQDILRDHRIRKALREREDTYLNNIAWLDEDLSNKIEENKAAVTIQKYFRRMNVLNTIASASEPGGINGILTMGPSGNLRVPKIWHCGHGSSWGRLDGKEEKKKMEEHYEDGLKNNTCFIHHENDGHSGPGFNTAKQMKTFQKHAKEGDIIFTHCAAKGGLTHYGFFTGKIVHNRENSRTSIHSHICVYKWISLSEVVKGVGRNWTLYEVTPTNKKGIPTKNFHNYIRPVLGIAL